MDIQSHIHIHFNGSAPSLSTVLDELAPRVNVDSTTGKPAALTPVVARSRFFNVYPSTRQSFALGTRLHDRADAAANKASPGAQQVELKFDANDRIIASGSGHGDRRFWAVLGDELGKNSFAESAKLMDEYPSADAYLQVSRDRYGNVSVASA